jgi:hypothetical protein
MEVSMPTFRLLIAALVGLVACSVPVTVSAQDHVIDPAALAATVRNHVAAEDADRAVVREALQRHEVAEIAARMGVDLARATTAVDTLSGADLERAAAAARQTTDALVGGQSRVVISTTTIIIALLVVILLIVAID